MEIRPEARVDRLRSNCVSMHKRFPVIGLAQDDVDRPASADQDGYADFFTGHQHCELESDTILSCNNMG